MRKQIGVLVVGIMCSLVSGCIYSNGYISAVDRYNQREAAEKAAAFDKFIGNYRVIACENPDLNIDIYKIEDTEKQKSNIEIHAKTRLLSKKETEKMKSAIGSGYIYAHIYDISINSVSYGGWEIIVQDSVGSIISRRNGPTGVAYSDGYNGWKNILICDIPNGIPEKTFKVYIINTISNERWGFEITKKAMP